MNHTDGNFQSNPGYGNDANVGYSPGQSGPIPGEWTKYDYQFQQYRDMYGYRFRMLFAKYPLTFLFIWYPFMFPFTYIVFLIAQAITKMMWGVNPLLGLVVFVIAAVVVLAIAVKAFVLWPVTALIMHRRRQGMWSNHLEWTDRFAPYVDFEYYENPQR